jgi:hypothetical protein
MATRAGHELKVADVAQVRCKACVNLRIAFPGLVLLLVASLLQPAAKANSTMPTADDALQRRMLAKAGFEPLEALARKGIEVQRAAYMIALLDRPSVEIRRTPDGAVVVSLRNLGNEATQALAPQVWTSLAERSGAAFVEPDPAKLRKVYRKLIRRYGYCHSWTDLEALIGGASRRITGSICFRELEAPSLAYADAMARIAVDHISVCEPDRDELDPVEALRKCAGRLGPATPEYRAIDPN